jgi:hypothetical protein
VCQWETRPGAVFAVLAKEMDRVVGNGYTIVGYNHAVIQLYNHMFEHEHTS